MIPALVQWEITDRCNYRCVHCYHLDNQHVGAFQKELNEKMMFKIAEILVKNKLFFVTFTGGEPLARKKLLLEISDYLYRAGIVLSLNSNLVLLDEKTLASLSVHRLLISCPATEESAYRRITGGGEFKQFELRLKTVIESGFNCNVNMVVSKANYGLVRMTANHLALMGVKRFAATPMSVNAGSPDFNLLLSESEVREVINDLIWVYENLDLEVDIMESVPKCIMPDRAFELNLPFIYRSCHAGQRNGIIAANGDVRPCSHNPQVFGNILDEEIGVIWQRMHEWRNKTGNDHMDCLNCDLFTKCGGGCRVDAAVRSGKTDSKHPYMSDSGRRIDVNPQPIDLKPETIIRPVRTFQHRCEGDGWLVAPGSSRNIILANETLYRFLLATRKLPPIAVSDLAEKFGACFNDKSFQETMKALIRKKYFIIVQ